MDPGQTMTWSYTVCYEDILKRPADEGATPIPLKMLYDYYESIINSYTMGCPRTLARTGDIHGIIF